MKLKFEGEVGRRCWLRRLVSIGIVLASALSHGGCAARLPTELAQAPAVTAEEAFAIAEAYRTIRWVPTEANAFHGQDGDGIRVDTPDEDFAGAPGVRPGWWKADHVNVGMPYQWGGFDTPESFLEKVRAGYFAGDVYTEQKRSLLDDGTSRQACGIDCSGFISRCWRLPRSVSTRELPELCRELRSFGDLQPGDIANKTNAHVLLFVRWLDADRTTFLAYEAGSPPTWKVLRHPISVPYIESLGYKPYRYRKMRPPRSAESL